MYVYHVAMESYVDSPETGIIDVWEPSGRCWEINSGPLQELPVLLNTLLINCAD